MEAEVLKSFLPNLVRAISDCVQPVSDQCLAKGLIPESVYKRVLESGGTGEDKARTLMLAVKTSTETDNKCLEILRDILKEQLPLASGNKLLSDISKALTENDTSKEVVTIQNCSHLQVPRETTLLQSNLLDRYEDSIRQHEHVRSEMDRLEKILKEKTEECGRLKEELEALKSQTGPIDEGMDHTQRRLTACEDKIETLKARFCQLENTIEEKDTKLQEERNTIMTVGRNMIEMVTNKEEEIKDLRGKIRKHM